MHHLLSLRNPSRILCVCAAFLLFGVVGPASAQQSPAKQPQNHQRPLIILTSIDSPSDDVVAKELASTITASVELVMKLSGSISVRRADFLAPTVAIARARRYYDEVGADGAVFGSVTPAVGGSYEIRLTIWNSSQPNAAPVALRRTTTNLLSSFQLADELAVSAASTIVGHKLREGTLVVRNTGFLPHFAVYADGHLLGRDRTTFQILTGRRRIVVAKPGGPLGDQPLQVFQVDIRDGRITRVALSRTTGSRKSLPAPKSAAGAPISPESVTSNTAKRSGTNPPPSPGGSTTIESQLTGSATINVKAAGELYLDGTRLASVDSRDPARLKALSLGHHEFTVVYADGHIDKSDATFGPASRVFATNFTYVPMQYNPARLFQAASLLFDDRTYRLRNPIDYSVALNNLAGLSRVPYGMESAVDRSRSLVKSWRSQRFVHVFWLITFWSSALLLGSSPTSSATLSATDYAEAFALLGSFVGLIVNGYNRGRTVGSLTTNMLAITDAYDQEPVVSRPR